VLGQKEDGGAGLVGCGAVAEPCGGRDAGDVFGRNASEVDDDGAEAAGLEQEVGDAECLVDAGERAESRGGVEGFGADVERLDVGLGVKDLGRDAGLGFGGARRNGGGGGAGEQTADGSGETTLLGARVGAETAAVQTLFGRRRGEIALAEGEAVLHHAGGAGAGGSTADPEEVVEVDAGGGGGLRVEGVGDVDPGGDFALAGDLGEY
jgi:hypothetical protein